MAVKKKFIKIEVPLINDELMALGTLETLSDKTIKLDLSRKLRGRGLDVSFILKDVDGKLVAYPKKMELTKQYIIRMIRKRVNYVEDSFKANCKDVECTIKPFMITRKKVSRAVRNNLRKTAKEFIVESINEMNYLDVCEEVLHNDLQKRLSLRLKKIYPLSFCELRVLETSNLNDADLTQKKSVARDLPSDEDTVKEEVETEEIEGDGASDESGEEAEDSDEKPIRKKKVKKTEED